MSGIDKWYSAKYITGEYTCSDFTRDVWLDLTGVDLAPALAGLLGGHDGRGVSRAHRSHFKLLGSPISPCIVAMQRPRTPVHLAVYVRGSILQLTHAGVSFRPPELATILYKSFRYFSCTI